MDRGSAGTFAGPWIDEASPPSRPWTLLLLAVLAGAVLGSGLTTWTNTWSAGSPAVPVAVPLEREGSELPREWRWAPRSVEYEHMFRKGASAPARSMFRRR